ncbi:penicillin-binding protein activator [Marinomonas transparens]|uniref:penicillin-binding protein activator n=1 Tax=Marinomonas transparens TaxID=2795388 RepID=UPI002D7E3D94|nr:penicillin-binding protein activator [Marinomonas transparens]
MEEQEAPESIYHPFSPSHRSQTLQDSLSSAQALYDQGEYQQAREVLGTSVLRISSNIQFDAYLLAALISSKLDDSFQTSRLLAQANLLPAALHPDNQNTLQETKAQTLEHYGNWLSVVNVRLALANTLPLGEESDNHAKLWQAVQNLTQNEIDALSENQTQPLMGWLTISNILRNQSLSIEQQLNAYRQWQVTNPRHTAALLPPQDFQIMASVKNMAPNNIVIMLPMKGNLERASQAIIDGFLSAYYNQQHARPQISVINTDDYASIEEALNAANLKEPDVIIGPLQKSNVARLSRLELPYPVIALNQLDINQQANNLYHFSLSAEDDIHELISFAKQEGATKAAILTTKDTWALKQSDEFRAAAEQENITITSNQTYSNTPKSRQNAIQKLLLVDESHNRKRLIENWTGSKVESIARSRKDLDYVYYVGKLNDAKQIRPLLDFYFADKIPMLASSTLNDTSPDKSIKSEDIERILFTEMPALTQRSNVLTSLNTSSNILKRLQALGADSYLLANRYQLFTLLPSTKISANTGIITIDNSGIFHKRPEIMTYRKGRLVNATSNQFFQQKETENSEK